MIETFFGLSPLLAVGLGGLLLMLAEALGKPASAEGFGPRGLVLDAGAGRASELSLGSSVILFAAAACAAAVWLLGPEQIKGLDQVAPYLIIDRFTLFFAFVLCLTGGLAALFAGGYLPEHRLERGEFFPLLLFSTLGALALAAAGDLLTLFIALETMSLGVYSLIGLRRGSVRATEAALKYFLLGSFSAAIMLFGAALLYGATGRTDLVGIGQAVATIGQADSVVSAGAVLIGVALMLTGLAFKVSAVPFHAWTPDAYEGAPIPVTGYMAAVVKAAAFAVLVRVLFESFGDERLMSWGTGWPPVLALLSVLTMTFANLVAGRQQSVKRMLAYSSIAHAGYALVGVVAMMRSPDAQPAVLFYLLGYALSTVGAFGALILCGSRGKEAVSYEDLAGLGKRHPPVALAFSLFLLSLAGVPPTLGFFGKLYVFQAAVGAELYSLVVIALVNSVLGAYYYLRVLVYMYMREPAPGAPVAVPMRSGFVVAGVLLSAIFVLFMGIFPDLYLELSRQAALGAG